MKLGDRARRPSANRIGALRFFPRPPARLFALLLVGAVGCGSSHHHDSDASEDESDSGSASDASARDARADTGLPGHDGGIPVDSGPALDASDDGGGSSNPDGGGDGGTGTLASAASLSFGLSPCGGAAPTAQTLSLTNPRSSTLNYTATLSATTAFTLSGATNGVLTGQLAAGASGTLTLTAA
ncbi:MAG: hypothetical protein JWN04_6756, partial [Myxococcaceae bacterium]|nr:hypothetical protein [Myxococcaceae bacterium]